MGFWDFLLGRPTWAEDDFFGRLQFFAGGKTGVSYFEGEKLFGPTGHRIGLALDGELPGPTAAQREFYQQVEAWYSVMLPALQQLIVAEFSKWQPDFAIQNFGQEFRPVHLALPQVSPAGSSVAWELAFETSHDRNHTLTVTMQDFQPCSLLVDG